MSENPSSVQPTDAVQSMVDARIDTLELKLMDLENTVQELNEVILRQYRDIEQLRLQQAELLNRLVNPAEPGSVPTVRDEVPPHY